MSLPSPDLEDEGVHAGDIGEIHRHGGREEGSLDQVAVGDDGGGDGVSHRVLVWVRAVANDVCSFVTVMDV